MAINKIVVKQEDPPIEENILAAAIRDIGAAARRMQTGGLTERAIIILLADASRMPFTTCRVVLHAMAELEARYCAGNVRNKRKAVSA